MVDSSSVICDDNSFLECKIDVREDLHSYSSHQNVVNDGMDPDTENNTEERSSNGNVEVTRTKYVFRVCYYMWRI